MVRISEMLRILDASKLEYTFIGDANSLIHHPFTGSDENNAFGYSMADCDNNIEYDLLISKFKINNKSKAILITKDAKFIFYHFISTFFYDKESQSYMDIFNDNLEIGRNNSIFNNVNIGNNVSIFENNVIGRPGYTYYDFSGVTKRLKPYGNIVIEDDVEISSFVNIDRGNVGTTLIKRGANIDSLVHIAHDVEIGVNTKIIAGTIIGGYTKIGDNTFVGMNVTIKNGLEIGNKVIIGMASNVTKSFGNNLILAGNPAKIFGINCDCGIRQSIREKEYQCACGLHYSIKSNTNIVKIKTN